MLGTFSEAQLLLFSSVDSTNNFAAKLLKLTKPPSGTAILARHQTAGRGQRGNIWLTQPRQNFSGSFLFYPTQLPATEQFLLSQIVSLGILDWLEARFNIKAEIKWPNDIYVSGGKIAGILLENELQGMRVKSCIAGIGINLNQRDGLPTGATSVALECEPGAQAKILPLEENLPSLRAAIAVWYDKWLMGSAPKIEAAYRANLMWCDIWKPFVVKGQELKCKILGVDNRGRLKLEKTDGNIFHADLKEVAFVLN